MLIEAYDSGHLSELVKDIPVLKVANGTGHRAIYRVAVKNVKKGDILDCKAYGQFSNDIAPKTSANNTMICHTIRAGIAAPETIEISEARGANVNNVRHHEDWSTNTFWVATADFDVLYVAVWAYAASSAVKSGWKITVNQDYGRLQVLHFRKDQLPSLG